MITGCFNSFIVCKFQRPKNLWFSTKIHCWGTESNRDQPEVRLCVGTFEVDVLAHVASRISSSLCYPSIYIDQCVLSVDQHQPVVVMKIDLFTWSGFSWIFSWPPNWDFKSIFITSEITSRLAFQLDWVEINQLRENTWREMNRNGSIRSDWNSIQSHVNSSYKALW